MRGYQKVRKEGKGKNGLFLLYLLSYRVQGERGGVGGRGGISKGEGGEMLKRMAELECQKR